MWLSVAADVSLSASSVHSDGHTQPKQYRDRPTDDSITTRSRSRTSQDFDLCLDAKGFRSSECEVTKTDSDSGAIGDAEFKSHSEDLAPGGSTLDGGYGWVVVVASFFNAFIIDGIGSCYGLVYPHVMEKYGASASVASFAGSLFNAFLVMGSVSVMLVRRFGYRKVTMSGGVLACMAFLISAWSPNVVCFVLFYGLFTGCACGLVFLPSVVIVNSYFHHKRGLANGIITSGSGAGLLVLAQLVNYLLEEFSLDGALLVLAGVLLNTCVFSSVYRPPIDGQRNSGKPNSREAAAHVTPQSGSTDSGLLSSPSLSPSVETISAQGKDLDGPCRQNDSGAPEIKALNDIREQNFSIENLEGSIKSAEEYTSYGPNHSGYMTGMHQTESFEIGSDDPVNDVDETELAQPEATLLNPNKEHDVPQYNGKLVNLYNGKKGLAYHEVGTRQTVLNTSLKNVYRHGHCETTGWDPHQLWKSAHNLPTQAAWPQHDNLHFSAHDVTQWGYTSTKRNKTKLGLQPLAQRLVSLGNPRYQRHSRSCHDHYQISTGKSVQTENYNQSNSSCNQQLCHPDHRSRDHLPQYHYHQNHQHSHHACHPSELDHGSNLYLTGSISTLRNLHLKHILHLATSQDVDHFPTQEAKMYGSKFHPSHGSKSHISEFGLPSSLPFLAKSKLSRSSKSHLSEHNTALLSADVKDSAPCHENAESSLPFSSKQSLQVLSTGPQNPTYPESSLPVSQWSLDMDTMQVMDAVEVESSSQISLVMPPSGYTLPQLLKMPCFYLFCVGSCLIQIGYPIPSIFLADLAYQQGLGTASTAVIMGVMGGLNIVGRLLAGLLTNVGVDPLTLLYTSLFLGGVACLLTPYYTTLWSLVLFSGLFGFLLGGFPPVQPLVIVEYFGLDSLASVFGFLTSIKGVSSMLGPPLAGLVYDVSGQYPMSFIFGGVVFLLSAAVHIAMPFFRPK